MAHSMINERRKRTEERTTFLRRVSTRMIIIFVLYCCLCKSTTSTSRTTRSLPLMVVVYSFSFSYPRTRYCRFLVSQQKQVAQASLFGTTTTTTSRRRLTTNILYASTRGGVGGGSRKNNRPGGEGKKKRKSLNSGSSSQRPSRTTKQASSIKTSSTTSAPPWQVMSSKDAQENVQREIQRRQLLQQGSEKSGTTSPDTIASQQSPSLSKNFLSPMDRRLIQWKRFSLNKQQAHLKFVGAFLDKQEIPRLGVPEIAFLGRSNVGKSSLLNQLTRMLSLSSSSSGGTAAASVSNSDVQARVGKTPGATASVNLYQLVSSSATHEPLLGWADLPGFGYAKLSKETKEAVQMAAEHYLGSRKELMLGILLVDIRRHADMSRQDDRAVLAALYDMGLPLLVVATKIDKIANGEQRQHALKNIRESLGLPENQPLAVSSRTGEGCRQLWQILLEACEGGVAELARRYEGGSTSSNVVDDSEDIEDYDSDEFVYDQGYDWVHGISEDFFEDEEFEYEDEDEMFPDTSNLPVSDPDNIKSLRKRARDLERRGEV